VRRAAIITLGLILVSAPAATQELRPAPEYYVDAIVAVTAAQSLARSCSTVSVDPVRMSRESERVLERLAEDGFDPSSPDPSMIDPSAEINARLVALFEGHGLASGATEAEVCAAASAELASGSAVADLLVEVQG